MSGASFAADWLALREELDHRSRSAELARLLAKWWSRTGASAAVDLGCGTGSNVRYLSPKLPRPQRWTLIDHDADLLARIDLPGDGVDVRTVRGDLAGEGLAGLEGADLASASALLDLVSPGWIEALADRCADVGCAALFALTYDGTIEWRSGSDPDDELVRAWVNAHQRRDKGLGPALGPGAGALAREAFERRGFDTRIASTPWELGPEHGEIAVALVEGWASAAAEERPEEAAVVDAWSARKRALVARGRFSLIVGHVDVLALPADTVRAGHRP